MNFSSSHSRSLYNPIIILKRCLRWFLEPKQSMDRLPDDVLLEILQRLPKKSSCKCKCVAKKWLHLISESPSSDKAKLNLGLVCLHFVPQDAQDAQEVFLFREPTYASFYSLDYKGGLKTEELRFLFSRGCPELVSYNGLLFYRTYDRRRDDFRYNVVNPTTKQTMAIPPRAKLNRKVAGFGVAWNSESNHWKVIVLYSRSISPSILTPIEVDTFDSKTGAWRTKPARFSEDPFLLCIFHYFKSAIYSSGALHWRCDPWLVILCLKTLTLRRIELPKKLDDTHGLCELLWESEGRLKYCQLRPMEGFCIWVLDRGAANWRKTYSLPSNTLISKLCASLGNHPEVHINRIMLCAFVEELQIVYFTVYGRLLRYDVLEETMTEIQLPKGIELGRPCLGWDFNGRGKLPCLEESRI